LNVVNVSSASDGGVDLAADRLEALAPQQLRAAREARLRAEHVLRAPGARLRADVLVRDEAVHEVGGPAALLDVAGDRADRRIAEVAHHPAQRADVKITSASMTGTASYQPSLRIVRSRG
jgi:hypothetical protein